MNSFCIWMMLDRQRGYVWDSTKHTTSCFKRHKKPYLFEHKKPPDRNNKRVRKGKISKLCPTTIFSHKPKKSLWKNDREWECSNVIHGNDSHTLRIRTQLIIGGFPKNSERVEKTCAKEIERMWNTVFLFKWKTVCKILYGVAVFPKLSIKVYFCNQ